MPPPLTSPPNPGAHPVPAMFAVKPSPTPPFVFGRDPASPYRPAVSSPLSSSPLRQSSSPPLSPLDKNALLRPRETQSSPIMSMSAVKPIPFKFAGRTARPNPLVQKRDDAREGRRMLFLNNVRQRAEDQKWERRGGENELLRLEWTRLTRELHQAKDTDSEGFVQDSDLEEAWQLQGNLSPRIEVDMDAQMVDALEQEEAAELDALVSSLPQPSSSQSDPGSSFFSDDDDYDALFNDLVEHANDPYMAASQDIEML
ncbi:hypothetical protein GQ53DRAFT_745503 [Thozetella sp. PMI_491]|nr:hypothetical protein GQ53DRAFT_745503 [Thozetella sp. PMI_491]